MMLKQQQLYSTCAAAMKSATTATQKRDKLDAAECLDAEMRSSSGAGGAFGLSKCCVGTVMGVPRALLAAVLLLQILLILCLRGLPAPGTSACAPPHAENLDANAAANNGDHSPGNSDFTAENDAYGSDFSAVRSFPAAEYGVSCDAGKVFVYEMPEQFNGELLRNCGRLNPWSSVCSAVQNAGFGVPVPGPADAAVPDAWFRTDQFMVEIMFHRKIMEHPCRTEDAAAATAFYVPFYAGLAVGRYLWSGYSAERRDEDAKMLIQWLFRQRYFRRHGGLDHFFTVGRITWDFRRSRDEDWGSSFLHMPQIQNVTRLLIEKNPWDDHEMGLPYPTAFHPKSSEEVVSWQSYLLGLNRSKLFAFAGAGRSYIPNDFRGLLLRQCIRARDAACSYLNCSNNRCFNNSMASVALFLDSAFCLQPRGDSYTRKSIFDCIIAGSIPVFFWNQTAYFQYKWHLPPDPESYSVFIPKNDVRNGTNVEDVLRAIPPEKVQKLRENVVRSIPGVIFTAPGYRLKNMKDAVDISVEGVLNKINELNLNPTNGTSTSSMSSSPRQQLYP